MKPADPADLSNPWKRGTGQDTTLQRITEEDAKFVLSTAEKLVKFASGEIAH